MIKNGFSTITILAVIAGVIALVGGGFLAYQRYPAVQPLEEKIGGEQTQEESQPTAGEIDTSNWKTYRNEQYGFEVRYPAEWDVSSVPERNSYLAVFFSDPGQRTGILFPNVSLNIGVPALSCRTAESIKEFEAGSASAIGDSEMLRACLNFKIGGNDAIVSCDFVKDDAKFLALCNRILDSIRVLK